LSVLRVQFVQLEFTDDQTDIAVATTHETLAQSRDSIDPSQCHMVHSGHDAIFESGAPWLFTHAKNAKH
jgi:hypothetical protein